MAIIEGVLKEELDRIKEHVASYRQMLSSLPKGSIVFQDIDGISYAYRKFKRNGKVISVYIGKKDSSESNQAIKDREEYLRIKKNLQVSLEEEAQLRKALRHYQ